MLAYIRKDLICETSFRIFLSKKLSLKSRNLNRKAVQMSDIYNLAWDVLDSRSYVVFIRFFSFSGCNKSKLIDLLGVSGIKIRVVGSPRSLSLLLAFADIRIGFVDLLISNPVFLLSTRDFDMYLKLIERCIAVETSDVYNNSGSFFEIMYVKERNFFLDFTSEAGSQSVDIRNLYRNASQKGILLQGICSQLCELTNSLSAVFSIELGKGANVFYAGGYHTG